MRSNEKKVGNTHLHTRSRRSGGALGAADGSSRRLRHLSGKLGNDAVSGKLTQGGIAQATMLDHIIGRLKNIQDVQLVEREQVGDVRKWHRQVAKGESGYHLPDPTRWHEVTTLYKQAADALVSGNLSRGSILLERAAEVEEATMATLPNMVTDRLQTHEKTAVEAPEEAAEGVTAGMTARCDRPRELTIAKEILAIQDTVDNAPPIKKTRKPWWNEVEEEEEEEDAADA